MAPNPTRVLVVEGEPSVLRVIGRVLGKRYDVRLASTVAAALEVVRENEGDRDLDLVLCDLDVGCSPDDFIEAVGSIRSRLRVRVAFMSADHIEGVVLRNGSTMTVLRKPFDPERLHGFVARRLALTR